MSTPQPTAAAAGARSWRWLAIAVASAAVLAGALAVALPRLIDSAVVKGEVERRISELTGGSVRYDAVSLRAFPWPRAGFAGVTLSVSGVIEGRVPQLEIDLALLPLLTGNARVTAIRASEPALVLHLPPGPGGDPLVAYRAIAGPIVAAITQSVTGATLAIAGGRLDVIAAGRPVTALANLDVTATVSTAAIDVQANCTGELWHSLRTRLSVVPGTLKASLQLDVTGADATALFAMLSAQGPLAWRGGAVDATVEATTDGQRALRGHLNAATPLLVMTRGERDLDVGAARVALMATRDDERLTIALEEVQLGDLLPAATGALRVQLDGGSPALDLQVPAIDVARLHAALATLTGDADAVRAMAAAVPAGKASGLTFAAAAADFSGLGGARAIHLDARLDGATVRIPAVDVTATEVAGRLVIAAGELTATGVAGVLGKGSFRDAALALSLAPAVSLRHLKADVDVDLAQALPVARRVLGPGPHPVLDDIETLAGRAVGTVIHDVRGGRPRTTFDITSIVGQARDRRLPFPLDVQAGALRYTDDRLTLRGMSGRFGSSQVTQADADFVFGAQAQLAGATGDFVVVLDEIYPWLRSLRPSPAALRGIAQATGTAGVHVARLAGNLADIDALDFDVVLAPTRLRIVTPALPGPLTLDGGSAAITPQRLALDRVRASLLDGSVIAAGTVDDYTSAAPRVTLALTEAAAGDAAIEWVRARWQLPLRTVPRAPLRISDGQVAVSGAGRGPWALQGALALAGEARAEFDLEWRDESLDLRRFALRDAWSDATVSFKRSGRSADIAFSGNVDNRTFEHILLHPPALQGEMRGNFRATVDLDEPQRTTATGTLDAEGTDLIERWGVPATIERLHLAATGSAARLSDTVVVIGGQKLALAGTVERRQSTYALDGQVTADDLDPARLAGALRPAEASATSPGRAGEWNLPVEGRIALAAASVTFGEGTVHSVVASASLSPSVSLLT